MRISAAGRILGKKNSPWGFTLFELIIVLVIVGLISVLAVPRLFNSMTHVELKTATRQTATLINQARDIAYFQKKRIKVSFDLDNDQIEVLEYTDKKFEQINSLKYSYPKGIKIKLCQKKDDEITQGLFDILFSSKGNSSGGTVTLGNIKKRIYTIEVDFITGNARIL